MGVFAFQHAYSKTDASDAELLELKQELTKPGPKKAQQDLADAIVAAQEMTRQRWKWYCDFVRKVHLNLLKSCSIMSFKGYLIWYHKTPPRAQRLHTYESVWKTLCQLYYEVFHKVAADDVGKEIANHLHGQSCSERGLIKGMRQKHVVGHNGLHGALYYQWKFDTDNFALKLERVQLATRILFLAFTSARSGPIFESGCEVIAGTNAALLYRDVKLRLLQPPDEASLLVLEVTIMLDKGKRKRNASKPSPFTRTIHALRCVLSFILWPSPSPTTLFPRLVSAGLTPYTLHNFSSPDGRITIDFAFRDDSLEVPIFSRSTRSMEGVHVDPLKALPANSISYWIRRSGQRAGFDHPSQPYALRQEAGTELTDRGATFLGTASKSDLIKEIGKLCLRRDPNLPKRLSEDQRTQAHQHPDVVCAKKQKDALAQRLQDGPGSIKNGSKSPDGIQHTRVQSKLRGLKLRLERDVFAQILREFHSAAVLDHMVTQLNGEEPTSKNTRSNATYLRRMLAGRSPFVSIGDESSFANMIDIVARLYSLFEGKDRRCNNHEGDVVDKTNKPSTCAQHSPPAIDEPLHSTGSIELAMDINIVKSLKEAIFTKVLEPIKSMKPVTSSKITKAKKPPTSLACLFLLPQPKP